MALQITVSAIGSLSVPDAYVRISDITGFKNPEDGKYYMTIGLAVFKDSTEAKAADGASIPCPQFDREKCEYDLLSTNNALVQAYTYLKTLSKFTGAIDL